jgi:hypothetical protein
LFWWTRVSLDYEPDIRAEDIRVDSVLPLSRQLELAKWSVLMFRLTFLSDVAVHASASGNGLGRLADLPERAVRETNSLSVVKLLRWIRREGVKQVDRALPEPTYERLAKALHKEE